MSDRETIFRRLRAATEGLTDSHEIASAVLTAMLAMRAEGLIHDAELSVTTDHDVTLLDGRPAKSCMVEAWAMEPHHWSVFWYVDQLADGARRVHVDEKWWEEEKRND